MLLLGVTLTIFGINFAIMNVYVWLCSFWILNGYPIPEEFKSKYPHLSEAPGKEGKTIVIPAIASTAIICSIGVTVSGIVILIHNDSMSIAKETLRIFSASSNPWLDVAKYVILGVVILSTISVTIGLVVLQRRWWPDRYKARLSGITLITCGSVFCCSPAGVCAIAIMHLHPAAPEDHSRFFVILPQFHTSESAILWILTLIALSLFKIGLSLRRAGRKRFTPIISPQDFESGSVLYLRSFADDSRFDRSESKYTGAALNAYLLSGRSEEEQLVMALKKIGRVVSVGQPGEKIPYAGATRMYLPLDDWKGPVRNMMRTSKLVVLSLGFSKGTMWELVEAMRILAPERLILLVPMSKDEYDMFRKTAQHELRTLASSPILPEYIIDSRIRISNLNSQMKAVIYFQAESWSTRWQPTFVWLETANRRVAMFPDYRNNLCAALRSALHPAVDRLMS